MSVLALCICGDDTYSKRLNAEDTLDELLNDIHKKWPNLTPDSYTLSYDISGKTRYIECDSDLKSIVLLCLYQKLDYHVINITSKTKGKELVCSSASHSAFISDSIVGESVSVASGDSDRSSLSYIKSVLRRELPNPIFQGIGQIFPGGVTEFRLNLILYSLSNGKKLTYLKNDPSRVTVKCATDSCPFRVHASKKLNLEDHFMIKTMNNEHTCGAAVFDMKNCPVKSKLIKEILMEHVRTNPHYKTKDVVDLFRTEYKLILKYYKAYTGKKLALEEIHGNDNTSYSLLESFCDNIKETNPGSFVILEKEDNTNEFKRVFISFEACIYGFRFCRPLIFLDGTFMRGKDGCIMSATAKNGNQGIFQLALAVVSGEDEDNWVWFLSKLNEMLAEDNRNFTFISDRHPGLLIGVPKVFPHCFHGYCFYHLKNNLKSSISRDVPTALKNYIITLFTQIAYASTRHEFDTSLEKFKKIGGAAAKKFLNNLPFENYANMFFPGNRYGEMSSNCAESFNYWIKEERGLPITSCLDAIRLKIMKFMSERRQLALNWNNVLCPKMEQLLSKSIMSGIAWECFKSHENVYEVISTIPHRVDLYNRTCSCNLWRINGFPCDHAVRCLKGFGMNIYDYVEDYFKVSYYRASYSHPIHPNASNQMITNIEVDQPIKPPKFKRRAGRPSSSNRIASVGEMVKRKTKCSVCKQSGHNKRSCNANVF